MSQSEVNTIDSDDELGVTAGRSKRQRRATREAATAPNHDRRAQAGRSSAPPAPGLLSPPLVPLCITRAGFYDLGHGAVLGYFPRALEHLARLLPALMGLPWQQREVVVMGRRVQQPRKVCYYADGPHLTYTYSGLKLAPIEWGAGPVAQIKAELEALLAREAADTGLTNGGDCGAGRVGSISNGGGSSGSSGGSGGTGDPSTSGGGGAPGAGGSDGGGSSAGAAAGFNSALLNLYEDGTRYVGWHRDDEAVFGVDPEIASVSFGATRDFQLREARDKGSGGGGGGGGGATRRLCVRLSPGDVLVMRGALQRHWQHCLPKRAGVDEARVSLTFRRIVRPAARR